MDVKEFAKKMKEKGYEVKHLLDDVLIVSEDNHYHVSIHSKELLRVPFDFLSSYVERQIARLKEGKASQF